MAKKKRDYAVGKGKPPKGTQFKPNQSGNPKGRPPRSNDIWTEVDRELKRRVPISENGRSKRITKRKAAAMQLVNAAAKGDSKALAQLLRRVKADEDGRQSSRKDTLFETEDHQLTIQNIVRRIRLMDLEESKRPDTNPLPGKGDHDEAKT